MTLLSKIFIPLLCGTFCLSSAWTMGAQEDNSLIQTKISHFQREDLEFGERSTDKDLIEIIKIHNPHLVCKASVVLSNVYESNPRSVISGDGKNKYGLSFTIHPEFMNYLMKQCAGKTVLELGAAGGEMSILLGCAGAKRVYVNDIEAKEIERFTNQLHSFPKKFRNKFTVLDGDCFEHLKKLKPGSMDIIYTRNLFHFFKSSQHETFLELIKTVLKPGGIIAMSVQDGRFTIPEIPCEDDICFQSYMLIFDRIFPSTITNPIGQHITACNDLDADPLVYENDQVVYFRNNKYEFVKEVFLKTPQPLRTDLLNFINNNRSNFESFSLTLSQIRLLKNTSMRFSLYNLGNILENNGFNLIKLSNIDPSGHAFQSRDPSSPFYNVEGLSNFVGAIATTPHST
jgi:SAM-dependent methyltransferase